MSASSTAEDASMARSAPGIIYAEDIRKSIGNCGAMAAFSLVAVEGVVLLTCVEWWRTAHSVVIRVDQAHLKHESRPRSRNSQLGPQGTPTALAVAICCHMLSHVV